MKDSNSETTNGYYYSFRSQTTTVESKPAETKYRPHKENETERIVLEWASCKIDLQTKFWLPKKQHRLKTQSEILREFCRLTLVPSSAHIFIALSLPHVANNVPLWFQATLQALSKWASPKSCWRVSIFYGNSDFSEWNKAKSWM